MTLFLLVFITIYGGAHAYFYLKLTRAVPLSRSARSAVATLLIFFTLAPIIVRVAEQKGHPAIAVALAYPGYCWMAVLFLFLVFSASYDLTAALGHLLKIFRRKSRRRTAPNIPRRQFQISLGVALLCSLYGLQEAQDIRTERITVSTSRLQRHEKVRVVQISDVHLGILSGTVRTQKIIDAVIAAKPDILVSTGDFIDGMMTHDGAIVQRFRQIKPRLGAFAIPGNHEYYVGIEQAAKMMREAGFVVLRGDFTAAGPILVAGADDPAAARTGTFHPLPPLPSGAYVLLLKHQPLVSADPPFDMQLSGHVHKGQIFPFNLVTWLRFRIKCGLTTLDNGRRLYVSRGTGTWGPPIRFLAPPEVTIIDLMPAGEETPR